MNKIEVLNFVKEASRYFFNSNNEKYRKWIEQPVYLKLYESVPEHTSAINFIANNITTEGIEILSYWDLSKLIIDYLIYGGFALEVIKTRGGGYTLNYIDIGKCRLSPNKDKVLYSDNWETSKVEYKSSDLISSVNKPGIFIFKNPKSRDVYPKPHYYSAIKSLDTMSCISEYHNNSANSGFSPNVVINFNGGESDDDTKRQIERNIEDKFSGATGKRFILSFNDSVDTKTTIEKLEDDNLDTKFETLQKFIQNQIIISHQITSGQLIGVKQENTGFSKTEYEEAMEIFKINVIASFRREIEYGLSTLFVKEIKLTIKED
jgi:hypothetical protein